MTLDDQSLTEPRPPAGLTLARPLNRSSDDGISSGTACGDSIGWLGLADRFAVCQPPHLTALSSPFRSVERNSCAIDFRQREPAANEADDCGYEKPERNEVNGEDRRKQRGMLVDETLKVVGRHSHASEPYRIFYPIPRRAERQGVSQSGWRRLC